MIEKKRQRIIFHASEKNGYVCNTHLVELSIVADTGEEAVAKLGFVLQQLLDALPADSATTVAAAEPTFETGGLILEPEVDLGPTFGGKEG